MAPIVLRLSFSIFLKFSEMIKWRKLNRALHRDLGYIFFGMTIIYSVSGIVLNHRNKTGDPSVVARTEVFNYKPVTKESFNKTYILGLTKMLGEDSYKNYYFPNNSNVMIYLNNGHINMNLESGQGEIIKIKKRPVLAWFNFLHYNKPKKLWTWFSDIFAVSLGLMAITGLFILKGKNGITRRGAVLVSFGLIVPLLFLIIYMW
jgi:hypothetical protein